MKYLLPIILLLGISVAFSKDNNLKCYPKKLKSGDTLTISMSVPHGKEFAIVDPNGTYFLLSCSSNLLVLGGEEYSIFEFDSFDTVKTVKLEIDSIEGAPFISGKKNNEKVFTKTGKYKILLSEDLHTEDLPVYECTVEFTK